MLLYKTAYFRGIKKNKTGIKKIKWKNYKKRKDVVLLQMESQLDKINEFLKNKNKNRKVKIKKKTQLQKSPEINIIFIIIISLFIN